MKYTGIFIPAEEGGYYAYCAEVRGANTQGETLAEAKVNLREAIALILESNAKEELSHLPKSAKLAAVSV